MRTTWVARLACWLGFHQPMQSGSNDTSVWGRCLRCNAPWQIDDPERWYGI